MSVHSRSPNLSIVTCTYNSEKYLSKALESIENQTFRNFEHIINDSYSSDSTLEILKNYIDANQSAYPIKFMQSPAGGVANALNVGTREASGDIIHYLHSDDYYFDDHAIERAMTYFDRNPEPVWVTGNFLVEINERTINIPQTHLLRIHPKKALSCMNIISHENTFVKTKAVREYGGFDEGEGKVVEYRLWLKLINDHTPLIVNDAFTAFIIHSGSTSTGSVIKFSKAILRAFNTQKEEKVFPLIGYYEDRDFYKLYKRLEAKVEELGEYLDI